MRERVGTMLKSMTGFGRSEAVNEKRKITVEIKSVNHRYLDMNIRLPKKLGFFEAGIRNVLKHYISRGKVDVFISYEDYSQSNVSIKYNETIANEYMNHFEAMSKQFGIANDVTVSFLAKCPEVLTLEEQSFDEEELFGFIESAVKEAAQHFVESRENEGAHLKQDLFMKLDEIKAGVQILEERGPEMLKEYRQRIYDKVGELLQDVKVDEGVLATEITIYADKICIDEESVRLKSHIETMKKTLESGDNIGRKLDFIAQEMNREANTMLSKANDLTISNIAIDLKTGIEKIREQIQNIE